MMTANANTVASKFVSREVFNAYVRTVNSRVETEEKLNDIRLNKIEAIISESHATINGGINLLNERLNNTNDRLESFKAFVSEKIDDTNNRITSLEARLNERIEHTDSRIDSLTVRTSEHFGHMEQVFSERLEHVANTLNIAVSGINQRITDMKDDLKAEQSKSLAKWGIGVALFVGAVQVAVSFLLHFWK